jgi:hypothetical protein
VLQVRKGSVCKTSFNRFSFHTRLIISNGKVPSGSTWLFSSETELAVSETCDDLEVENAESSSDKNPTGNITYGN